MSASSRPGSGGPHTGRLPDRFVAVLVALVLGLVAACAGSTTTSNNPSGSAVDIGFIGPLTGPVAGLGGVFQDGMKAGVQYVNKHGGVLGRPLNLVSVDSAANPTQAAAVTRQLLGQGVVAITGDLTSGAVLAEMGVVNNSDKPVPVMAGGSDDAIFNVGTSPWAFTDAYVASLISQSYIDYLVKVRGFKQIGILHGNDAFGLAANTAAVADLKLINLTPVDNESVVPGSTDVTVQLRKLQASGAQALLLLVFGNDSITALKGLSAVGWHPPSETSITVSQAATRTAVGLEALANVYGGPISKALLAKDASLKPTGITGEFLDIFRAIRGGQLQGEQLSPGVVAFDDILVIAEAINLANSLDAHKIRAALESGHLFQGAQGTIQYSANSHIGLPYSLYGQFRADVVCTGLCVEAPTS